MMPALTLVASIVGLLLVAASCDEGPPAEPIPLAISRVATPVHFPHTPPILVTPFFVSTVSTPSRFTAWQRRTLMDYYIAPQPTPDMGH